MKKKHKKKTEKINLQIQQEWYMKKRLKFIQDMLDLLFTNQDILKNVELGLFELYCNEEKQMVDCYRSTTRRKLERYFAYTIFTDEFLEYKLKKEGLESKELIGQTR